MQRLKVFIIIPFLFVSNYIFSQESIIAKKEILTKIQISDFKENIRYEWNDEGFFSPGGIFVDANGRLFFIPNYETDSILVYSNGKFYTQPAPSNLPATWYGPSSRGVSQYGTCGQGMFFFILEKGNIYRQTDFYNSQFMESVSGYGYLAPWGAVWESEDHGILLSAEFQIGEVAKVRSLEETRVWLPTQPGGFSIGDNSLLYRNGMVWSAVKPKGAWTSSDYIGKLASGHNIFAKGWHGQEEELAIADGRGEIELIIEIPWAANNNPAERFNMFDYGVGPWGEIYYLIPPESMWKSYIDEYGGHVYSIKPYDKITEPAELVVVRNHLKYFGRLNDDKVRLRKGPSTATESLGTYPVKTGFRILEKGTAEETIGGQKNVWYKVRLLDGTEGWFFGAFVHNLYDGPNGNPPPWPNVADW